MAEVLPFARPVRREDFTAAVGMAVALGAFAMLFASLFFVYAGLRIQAPSWPPPGVSRPPLALPALSTAVILCSSGTLAFALQRGRAGQARAMQRWLGITLLVGIGFLLLQLTVWWQLRTLGIRLGSGVFGAVMLSLTLVHGLHVLAGLGVLAQLYRRARKLRSAAGTTGLMVSGMFWHFVDVVWLVMFLSLFVY